ncbi:MAG: hypothetical protein K6U12_03510 [Armatimonadetes bacterium]|nr:hypothetical protein [Armatimonadota bacterium]CUU34153.1 hypothetical protein DCOP10_1061 [Armatimonadetes bacterium DC]
MLFHRNRVAPLIEALQSADAESRQKAYRALQNLLDRKIHLDEARTALEAAGAEYPLQESEFDDPQRLLLQIAAKKPDPTFIPVIERDFGRYSPRAQTAALDLLVTISTPNAIQSLCALLAQAEGDTSCLAALESRTEYAPLLFPTLLTLLARQENAHHHFYIARLYLRHVQAGAVPKEVLAESVPYVLACYDSLASTLMPQQKPHSMRWIWDDELYMQAREIAGVLLDLMGYLESPEVRQRLQAALAYTDPYLLLYAACSLLRLGESVPHETLRRIAADAETRRWLFEYLQRMELAHLFPEEYRNQAALAESDMVDWLIFPTELGCPPDEIQLVGVYTIETGDGLADAYLFRFRMEGEDWEAGLAGLYPLEEQPLIHGTGDTFSRFDKWQEYPAEEHVDRILDLSGHGYRIVRQVQYVEDFAP